MLSILQYSVLIWQEAQIYLFFYSWKWVYVDEPVKFMPKNEDIAGIISNHEICSISGIDGKEEEEYKRQD